ncbi:hypothetical protein K8Z61_03340 [Nocardioides sp. TRM66260-LWL]|uniref:M48 family metalloprotease n=1 Tax=Nocardioides sp. TRM66260-LWL TaxID=2874478 RepID=UPI001CC65B7B|nr:M48 family metalloprotease [Nocardioides sp. TRM66260-LWL]MBZ5733520.1 hypothetical protein [Nocardioides sp. TRM66260-LWL]
MTAALALLAFAALVRISALRVLPGAAWPRRAPRLGVVAWQAVTLAVPASVILAGLALAVPVLPVAAEDMSDVLGACAVLLREHYETPGGFVVGFFGLLGAVALSARWGFSVAGELRTVHRHRARQRDGFALVSRRDVLSGTWVVDDERPAVFCIPGHPARVVVTTGALSVLTPQQRVLALAHEKAHLTGRHHLALTLAAAARRAHPRSRLFAVAEAETAMLVEMHADDRAAVASDRPQLAAALVKLAAGPQPVGTMAINGGPAIQRVQRLLTTGPALTQHQRWSIRLTALTLMLAPVLIAAAPALEAALLDYCRLPIHT